MSREQDAQIAERLFGWRWMMQDGYGGTPKQRVALFPPEAPNRVIFNMHDDAVDVTGRQHEYERFSDWDQMAYRDDCDRVVGGSPRTFPRYTTEASDDYLVLEKVVTSERDGTPVIDWDKFLDALYCEACGNPGAGIAGIRRYELLANYEPGMYSAAVLDVWENES